MFLDRLLMLKGKSGLYLSGPRFLYFSECILLRAADRYALIERIKTPIAVMVARATARDSYVRPHPYRQRWSNF